MALMAGRLSIHYFTFVSCADRSSSKKKPLSLSYLVCFDSIEIVFRTQGNPFFSWSLDPDRYSATANK